MLNKILSGKKIILGSKSPRRQMLLKGLDIDFEVLTKDTDESWPSHLNEEGIPKHLSLIKSLAFGELKKDIILITADTIVWSEGKPMNKPADANEAVMMLKHLSGKTHYVYTGVTIRTSAGSKVFSDETAVEFRAFSPAEVEYYVSHYSPLDKAGGYGAQDWIGYIGIERLDGCYYNVMGLPVRKVYEVLKEM